MSVRVLSKAMRESRAELGTRLVAFALADSAHDDGVTWVPQDVLTQKTLLSERQVRNALAALVELGELTVVKVQRGRRRVNVYRLIYEGLCEPDYDRMPAEIAEALTGRPAKSAGRQNGDDRQNPTVTTGNFRPPLARAAETRRLNRKKNRKKEPTAIAVAPEPPVAPALVGFYVDECRKLGSDPPSRVKGQVAREVAKLLAEGVEPRDVALGLRLSAGRGLHPAALASAVHEARMVKRPRGDGVTGDEALAVLGYERSVRPDGEGLSRAGDVEYRPIAGGGAAGARRELPAARDDAGER